MAVPKVIYIKEGKYGKVAYYYWDEYDNAEEARIVAKRIKEERRNEMKIKYYLLKSEDSWFLPVTKYVVYLNRNLRVV